MKIHLICFGKVRKELEAELSRLKKMLRGVDFLETELKESKQSDPKVKLREEKNLFLKKFPKRERLVVLDERGKEFTSQEFSTLLFEKWCLECREIHLLIGSAYGIDPELKVSSQFQVALTKMTLPHDHARLLLVEQVYRAHCISINHPYHHV